MSVTDQHDRELAEEMWAEAPATAARYAALYEADQKGFFKSAERAIAARDMRAILAMGRVLEDWDALTDRRALKLSFPSTLASSLLEHGRFEEAARILTHPGHTGAGHPKSLHLLARALAGAGRLDEARETARRSVQASPGFKEGIALADRLTELIRLHAGADALADWRSVHQLTELYLEFGLADAAGAFLGRVLAAPPPDARGCADEAVSVLERACELLGPDAAGRADVAVKPGALAEDRLEALRIRRQRLLGRASSVVEKEGAGVYQRLELALAKAAAGDLGGAIERLGALSVERKDDIEIRNTLAYWVGRDVSRRLDVRLRADGAPKVFNLVPFNDELTMLELRLAEMAPWVDHFVIVEARHTFTGADKPLYFQEVRNSFSGYGDKLLHVVVDAPPAYVQAPWARDFHQRDMAVRALDGLAGPEDLVFLTDADEIVDRRAVDGFEGQFACLRMGLYRFFLNYRPSRDNQPERRTAAVFRAKHLLRYGSSYGRFALSRHRALWPVIRRAGWHFTSMRDPAGIVAKVNSYAHQERPDLWRDEDRVAEQLERIRRGEVEPGWERCDLDESFPEAVRLRAAELAELIL